MTLSLALVYQGGIANIFEMDYSAKPAGRVRIMQSDFASCEMFCNGAEKAGAHVVAYCSNVAGDIADLEWITSPDNAPFAEGFGARLEWFKRGGYQPSQYTNYRGPRVIRFKR